MLNNNMLKKSANTLCQFSLKIICRMVFFFSHAEPLRTTENEQTNEKKKNKIQMITFGG